MIKKLSKYYCNIRVIMENEEEEYNKNLLRVIFSLIEGRLKDKGIIVDVFPINNINTLEVYNNSDIFESYFERTVIEIIENLLLCYFDKQGKLDKPVSYIVKFYNGNSYYIKFKEDIK